MEDPRNQGAIAGVKDPKEWLGKRIEREGPLQAAFINMPATRAAVAANYSAVWKKERVVAYRQAIATVWRDLAALMHMTRGAPL